MIFLFVYLTMSQILLEADLKLVWCIKYLPNLFCEFLYAFTLKNVYHLTLDRLVDFILVLFGNLQKTHTLLQTETQSLWKWHYYKNGVSKPYNSNEHYFCRPTVIWNILF